MRIEWIDSRLQDSGGWWGYWYWGVDLHHLLTPWIFPIHSVLQTQPLITPFLFSLHSFLPVPSTSSSYSKLSCDSFYSVFTCIHALLLTNTSLSVKMSQLSFHVLFHPKTVSFFSVGVSPFYSYFCVNRSST